MSLGHGTTITFDSGFFAEILSMDWDGIERPAVPTTHFGTSTGKTFVPSDTYDPGELSVEIHHNTTDDPPIDSAAETLTITFPDTETHAVSGFLTRYRIAFADEEKIRATGVVKFSGDITWSTP